MHIMWLYYNNIISVTKINNTFYTQKKGLYVFCTQKTTKKEGLRLLVYLSLNTVVKFLWS